MIYDAIIYSANISGVVASIILKNKGQKVLLLNRYGFFGGTITESLNLLQKKIEFKKDSITQNIFTKIAELNEGILFEDESRIILNPEVVKYVLQKVCEENEFEILFHITPYKVEVTSELINFTVIGREGEIKFSTRSLIDLSTEFTFAPLLDKHSRKFIDSRINFISLPVKEIVLKDFIRKIKLKDERWWISVDLRPNNLFDVEEIATQTLDKIDELLRRNKSRIQIVPAQSQLNFLFKKTNKFDARISFITDHTKKYEPEEELFIAQKIEEQLNNESNL
jgi:hypothetical protein